MEFLSSHEFQIGLIVEAGILLLIAIGFICYLLRRLARLSRQVATSAHHGSDVSEYLRSEIKKTQEKQARLGKNNPETVQLRDACRLREHILAGEIHVLDSTGEDEAHYWQPVLDYYGTIRTDSSTKIKMLEEHLGVSQRRIENLEKFKEKVFQLRETLDQAYENNSHLEKELREKIKQGAKLSELEHTLSQMERDKEDLVKELRLAENEFVILMENAGAGKIGIMEAGDDLTDTVKVNSLEKELKEKIASLEEENSFLCDQIQALLTLEVELEGREGKRDRDYLTLEKRYAKMEERYLNLQEKLEKYQQAASG